MLSLSLRYLCNVQCLSLCCWHYSHFFKRCLGIRFLYPVYCIAEVEITLAKQTNQDSIEKGMLIVLSVWFEEFIINNDSRIQWCLAFCFQKLSFKNEAIRLLLWKWVLFAWEFKKSFRINGFVLSLALKQRLEVTGKWPISYSVFM